MKDQYQVVVIGGGIVGLQRAVSPDAARHDGRRADRARGAHRGVHLARGRRVPRDQRRHADRGAAEVHDRPLPPGRGGVRPERRAPHVGRDGARRHARALALAEVRAPMAAHPGHRRLSAHPRRGGRARADHRSDRPLRRALRSARGQPRSERRHAGVRGRRPQAGRRGDPAQPRPLAHAHRGRRVARRDRAGRHHGRARRERRRAVGAAGSATWSASTTRSCRCRTTTS